MGGILDRAPCHARCRVGSALVRQSSNVGFGFRSSLVGRQQLSRSERARCGLGVGVGSRRQSRSMQQWRPLTPSFSYRSDLDLRVSASRAGVCLVSTMCCECALQALFARSAAQAGCSVEQAVVSWAQTRRQECGLKREVVASPALGVWWLVVGWLVRKARQSVLG